MKKIKSLPRKVRSRQIIYNHSSTHSHKFLLIDLPAEAEDALKTAGYNVSIGSFGTPYKVVRADNLTPVITDGVLPNNYTEQDIVVIDLADRTALEQPAREKHTSSGENDWWVSCKRGFVDPRPRLMLWARDSFDRILEHGGIFIIFAEERFDQEFVLGHLELRSLKKDRNLAFDNWCFLSILNHIHVKADIGKEIIPIPVDHPLIQLLTNGAS